MSCLGCGGACLRRLHDKGEYWVAICEACRLVQLDPLPSEEALHELYTSEYFGGNDGEVGYDDYAEQEEEYLATFRDDVRRIAEFVPQGRVLDVGCAHGYFVRCAVDAGYDAYGIDLSAEAIAVAEARLPGRFQAGSVDSAPMLEDKSFDVIFAAQLIEHIVDPRAFLETLVAKLNPGGILVLVTPNVRSVSARLAGSRWVAYKIPEHVVYFDPSTLGRLVRGAGLKVLATDSAWQVYRLPFLMSKVREMFPLGRLLPRVETSRLLHKRMVRVPNGSLRLIAQRPPTG